MNKRLEKIVKKLEVNGVISVRKDVAMKLINEVKIKSIKHSNFENNFMGEDTTLEEVNEFAGRILYSKISCSANIRYDGSNDILLTIALNSNSWYSILIPAIEETIDIVETEVIPEEVVEPENNIIIEVEECFVGIDSIKRTYFNSACHNAMGRFFMGSLTYEDAIKIINKELNPKGIYVIYKNREVDIDKIIVSGEGNRGKTEFFFEDFLEIEDLILFELNARKCRGIGYNKTWVEIPHKELIIRVDLDKDFKVLELVKRIKKKV